MSEFSRDCSDTDAEDSLDAETYITRASSLKSSGNDAFKASLFKESAELYKEAIDCLMKIPQHNSDQKSLLSVVYCNLCAAYIGSCDFSKALESANEAIKWDSGNMKAYYRRAQANYNMGAFEDAKSDCNTLLKDNEPDSNVRILLRRINEQLRLIKEEQKKAFGGLFDKAGGLYEDKLLETQKKKQKKYADYKKEAQEKGEVEMDFESWEKKNEETEREAEQVKEERSGPTESPTKDTPKIETSELDDEDEKIIKETKKMGYCYFGKDISNSNPSMAIPQKLNVDSLSKEHAKRSISSWNSQGTTYEEKDMTSWCKKKFEECVGQSIYESGPNTAESNRSIVEMLNEINLEKAGNESNTSKMQKLDTTIYKSSIKVTSIEGLEGDAHIALIRGSRRYMFDFSCKLNIEISIDTNSGLEPTKETMDGASEKDFQTTSYHGVLLLNEISSEMETGKTWSDCMAVKFTEHLKKEQEEFINEMIKEFTLIVCDKINEFISQYQMQ